MTTPDCIIRNSITNESMSVINEWESLQRDLNLDKETAKLAWKSYQDIKQNYTLEVLTITYKPVVLSWSQLLRSSFKSCDKNYRIAYRHLCFPGQPASLASLCFVRGLPELQPTDGGWLRGCFQQRHCSHRPSISCYWRKWGFTNKVSLLIWDVSNIFFAFIQNFAKSHQL